MNNSYMTLKDAIDAFRDNPSIDTASDMQRTIWVEHGDGLISDDMRSRYLAEIEPWIGHHRSAS